MTPSRTARARRALQVAAVVSVILFTGVLSVASIVWQAQHNEDRIEQARAGCERGNALRGIINRQGRSIRTVATGSAQLLEDLLAGRPQDQGSVILRRQAEDYRAIAADVRRVALIDCERAYR